MKIELDRQDIIDEIKDKYTNDVDFFYDVIDKSTVSWEPVKELINRLIYLLKENDEFNMEDYINND